MQRSYIVLEARVVNDEKDIGDQLELFTKYERKDRLGYNNDGTFNNQSRATKKSTVWTSYFKEVVAHVKRHPGGSDEADLFTKDINIKALRVKKAGAIKLQSVFRGYSARKVFSTQKRNKKKQ